MYLNIKNDSIFVADAHYNEKNGEFLIFLEKLKNEEIKTTQLFLMGDMFDFITGECLYFIKRNQKLVDIINRLSSKIEIIYLEGNHDYNLQNLFPNVLVIPRDMQPFNAMYEGKNVQLCHGDKFTPKSYDIYCKVIRNKPLLKFLNLLDFNNYISKKIYYTLMKKNICTNFVHFKQLVEKRIQNFNAGIVIEGHFHQGKEFFLHNKHYVNIPSLCCSKEYMVLNKKFIKHKL